MILAHLLTHDRKVSLNHLICLSLIQSLQALLQTIKDWPKEIYDLPAVLVAIHAELDRIPASSSKPPSTPDSALLMECLAELCAPLLVFYTRLTKYLTVISLTDNLERRLDITSGFADPMFLLLFEKIISSRTSRTKYCSWLNLIMN